MTRRKHALQVSDVERTRIRALYLEGVRLEEIVQRTHRSIAVVQRTVRGMKRQRPPPPRRAAIVRRDAQIVADHKAGQTIASLANEFGISTTRVWQIVERERGGTQREPLATQTVPSNEPLVIRPVEAGKLSRAKQLRRNRRIRALHEEGVPVTTLARRFQLSRFWVYCVLKASAAARH